MAFLGKVRNNNRLSDKIRYANNDSNVVEITKQSEFLLPPIKLDSMKIAHSKGMLEFADGRPVNQYLNITKSRLNTFHWTPARQTIRTPKLIGTSLGIIPLISILITAIGIVTT